MSTTLTSKEVSIRKPRECFACFRNFEVGEKMNYWTGVVDGDFMSCYSCKTCQELMRLLRDDYTEGFPHGFVFDDLNKNESPEQLLERIKK